MHIENAQTAALQLGQTVGHHLGFSDAQQKQMSVVIKTAASCVRSLMGGLKDSGGLGGIAGKLLSANSMGDVKQALSHFNFRSPQSGAKPAEGKHEAEEAHEAKPAEGSGSSGVGALLSQLREHPKVQSLLGDIKSAGSEMFGHFQPQKAGAEGGGEAAGKHDSKRLEGGHEADGKQGAEPADAGQGADGKAKPEGKKHESFLTKVEHGVEDVGKAIAAPITDGAEAIKDLAKGDLKDAAKKGAEAVGNAALDAVDVVAPEIGAPAELALQGAKAAAKAGAEDLGKTAAEKMGEEAAGAGGKLAEHGAEEARPAATAAKTEEHGLEGEQHLPAEQAQPGSGRLSEALSHIGEDDTGKNKLSEALDHIFDLNDKLSDALDNGSALQSLFGSHQSESAPEEAGTLQDAPAMPQSMAGPAVESPAVQPSASPSIEDSKSSSPLGTVAQIASALLPDAGALLSGIASLVGKMAEHAKPPTLLK